MSRKIIYKEKLKSDKFETKLYLPKESKIIKAGIKDNEIFIWYSFFKVFIDKFEERTFILVYTGEEYEEDIDMKYIETVYLEDSLVYHIFEKK